MAVREIAASFQFVCDGCGKVETKATKSRPTYWQELHILRDAYDYQGCAVADGSIKRLLCLDCATTAEKAINAAIAERKAALAQPEADHAGEVQS